MPASVDLSAFFIELAEEMELTFCEQIDNGCPVLLGLWNNVLKAEVRLYRLLGVIDQFRDYFITTKHTAINVYRDKYKI